MTLEVGDLLGDIREVRWVMPRSYFIQLIAQAQSWLKERPRR